MIEVDKYQRRPFFVEAVKVTVDNMREVAEWCNGSIIETTKETYIKVKVKRPTNHRQTTALIGDWVLSSEYGYKVFSPRNFDLKFAKVGS